jgi:hypothetical protein
MKYLKTYEEVDPCLIYDDCRDSWYWKVTTKYPEILVIFNKLGVPEGWGNWLWSKDNHLIKDFYLFKTDQKGNWSYSKLSFKNPSYIKPPVYMGEVEITEDDYEKWRLSKDIKKYNL